MSRWLVTGMVLAVILALCAGTEPVWSADEAEDMAVAITEDYEVDWIWGDVVAKTAASVTIQYLDYEDDIEKQMTIAVDDKTAYENIASLAEIQVGDTVSIDYTMQPNGDGMAQLISKEGIADTDGGDAGVEAVIEESMPEEAPIDPSVSSIPVE